jgi:hypothetical protein
VSVIQQTISIPQLHRMTHHAYGADTPAFAGARCSWFPLVTGGLLFLLAGLFSFGWHGFAEQHGSWLPVADTFIGAAVLCLFVLYAPWIVAAKAKPTRLRGRPIFALLMPVTPLPAQSTTFNFFRPPRQA